MHGIPIVSCRKGSNGHWTSPTLQTHNGAYYILRQSPEFNHALKQGIREQIKSHNKEAIKQTRNVRHYTGNYLVSPTNEWHFKRMCLGCYWMNKDIRDTASAPVHRPYWILTSTNWLLRDVFYKKNNNNGGVLEDIKELPLIFQRWQCSSGFGVLLLLLLSAARDAC